MSETTKIADAARKAQDTTPRSTSMGGDRPAADMASKSIKDAASSTEPMADAAAEQAKQAGRTFQAARLYPELTVRDTVQLALEARDPTSFWGSLLWVPSIRPERRKYADARELIDYLGLGRYADRYVAELSTGTRRIVELACVLAVAPRVICLDEPTAGVAQREAEAFGPLILRIKEELDL